jgi:hypothetical protein
MSILYDDILEPIKDIIIEVVGDTIPVGVLGVHDDPTTMGRNWITIRLFGDVEIHESSANSIQRRYPIEVRYNYRDETDDATEKAITDFLEKIDTKLWQERNQSNGGFYGGESKIEYGDRRILTDVIHTEVF